MRFLDQHGRPMAPARQPRHLALSGGTRSSPYDGASYSDEHTAGWDPILWSPDGQTNLWRDRLAARARDLVLNDGWASGTVTRIVDNAVGAQFRPVSKPDHYSLAAYTGDSRFDAVWADEFGRAVDARWRDWADDHVGKYCDVQRVSWISLMLGVAFRHLLIDNDALAVMKWMPQRVGLGRARYATAVQLLDPDRLSNPQQNFDVKTHRGGAVVDDDGATIGFEIRKAHQGDWWAAADAVTWEFVPRETEWGRPIGVHYWEPQRAGEHRGGAGIFTPVLQRARMLFKYDQAELDAALLNAIMAAVAESPMDPTLLQEAMEGEGDGEDQLNAYQDDRADFYRQRRVNLRGVQFLTAFPGESYKFMRPERPNPNFGAFEKNVLRNMSQAAGTASQWVSGDYSDTNYSSMRAALLDAWKTIHRRRHNFGAGFASPIRAAWLEEAMEVDELPLPPGAPEFIECRTAYARCKWMGPGRGWVDPVADKQGAVLGMDAGLSTLEHEAAEQSGMTWEEILDQRQVEIAGFKRRGIAVPTWSGMQDANKVSQKPEAT